MFLLNGSLNLSRPSAKSPTGGRPSEQLYLTVDCFKQLCMMANTEKGREVRKYFLECERKLKDVLRSQFNPEPEAAPQSPQPKALPPAPGWKQEDWEALPVQDQQYFSESPEQAKKRVSRERRDMAGFLQRCWDR